MYVNPAAQTASTSEPPREVRGGAIVSDFQTFLTMLTVQMRNQDPLNPMEASDFAVQLATFSGVEQQVRTNGLLEAQQARAALAEIGGLVGRTARAAMPARYDGQPLELATEPVRGADRTELVVRNELGNIVDRRTVPTEESHYSWSGLSESGLPLPSGNYSFDLVGYAGAEEVGSRPTEVYARVIEARLGPTGTVLTFPGGVSADLSKVTGLRAREAD